MTDIVTFNVGGRTFATQIATILSIPDSTLAYLVRDGEKSSEEAIFIDRNPEVFQIVLDIYRYKQLLNHKNTDPTFLRAELEFYGLENIVYEPQISLVPPKRYRQIACVLQNSQASWLYPDTSQILKVENLCHDSLLHVLSELRIDPGLVQQLDITTVQSHMSDSVLSELCHLIESARTLCKVSIRGNTVPRKWKTIITKALNNPHFTILELTIPLDVEDAHSLVDSMQNLSAGNVRTKTIVLRGITDTAAKNVLARRPFSMP